MVGHPCEGRGKKDYEILNERSETDKIISSKLIFESSDYYLMLSVLKFLSF